MMKIAYLSDVHVEAFRRRPHIIPQDLEFDVLVVAGDLSSDPAKGLQWLIENAQGKPVVFVPGNHDFWHPRVSFLGTGEGEIPDFFARDREYRQRCGESGIHYLNNDSVMIDNVRFVGTPLFTDLGSIALGRYDFPAHSGVPNGNLLVAALNIGDCYYSGAASWYTDENIAWAKDIIAAVLDNTPGFIDGYDFHFSELQRRGLFHPLIAWQMHCEARDWLESESPSVHRQRESEPAPACKKTVIVTHHPPSWKALVESGKRTSELIENRNLWASVRKNRRDELGITRVAGYGSSQFPRVQADLWLHGHLHCPVSYIERGIPIYVNPYGYAGDVREFDPRAVIDLERFEPRSALRKYYVKAAEVFERIHGEMISLQKPFFARNALFRKLARERFQAIADEAQREVFELERVIADGQRFDGEVCVPRVPDPSRSVFWLRDDDEAKDDEYRMKRSVSGQVHDAIDHIAERIEWCRKMAGEGSA